MQIAIASGQFGAVAAVDQRLQCCVIDKRHVYCNGQPCSLRVERESAEDTIQRAAHSKGVEDRVEAGRNLLFLAARGINSIAMLFEKVKKMDALWLGVISEQGFIPPHAGAVSTR